MNKYARQIGVTKAFLDHGYSPETIKLAYTRYGLPLKTAESLVKEAIPLGWLSKVINPLTKGLGGAFGAGAKYGPLVGSITQGMMYKGPFSQWLGRGLHGGATGLQQGLLALNKSPLQALGRGALETGKGALFFGGKGIGGTLGKGIGGYQMANMLFGDRK